MRTRTPSRPVSPEFIQALRDTGADDLARRIERAQRPRRTVRIPWWLLAGIAMLGMAAVAASEALAYVIPDGSPVRWRCPGGSAGVVAVTTLNKGANPIGSGAGGNLDRALWDARYGKPSPALCGGVEPVFLLYAEQADSYLQGAMREACLRGEPAFLDQQQWDCWPGPNRGAGASIEAYDYAAVAGIMPGAPSTPGGASPAVPAITAASSPAPGQVALTWRARAGMERYDAACGPGVRAVAAVAGEVYHSTVVEMPPGTPAGEYSCTVVAWIGSRSGKPSLPRVVRVEAASAPPPPPPPPPPPDEPGECPACPPPAPVDCTALRELLGKVEGEVARVCGGGR